MAGSRSNVTSKFRVHHANVEDVLHYVRMVSSLSTGQGTRFVLAATEHLHRRIGRLSARVRQLEDALSSLHAQHSDNPHPLLDARANNFDDDDEKDFEKSGDQRAIGMGEGSSDMGISAGMDRDRDRSRLDGIGGDEYDRTRKTRVGGRDVIDAFGTLSISDHGISRFFGPTGGSESLLIAHGNRRKQEDEEERDKDRQDNERSRSRSANRSLRASASPRSMEGKDREDEGHTSSSLSPTTSHQTTSSSIASVGTGATSLFSATGRHALVRSQGQTGTQSPILFSSTFPFTPLGLPTAQIMNLIQEYLPERRRAEELLDVYYGQLAWLFRGVGREQAEEMIWAIYGALGKGVGRAGERGWESEDDEKNPMRKDRGRSRHWGGEAKDGANRFDGPLESNYQGPHDLSLLFMLFAASALVETEPKETDADERERHGQSDAQMQWGQTHAGNNMIIMIGDEEDGAGVGNASRSHSGSAPTSPPYMHGQPAAVASTHSVKSSAARATALADHYHQLAQAALSLQPVLEKPSIVTIQVLHLMSIYNAMAGNEVRRDDGEDGDDVDDERGGRSRSRKGRGKSKSVGREKSRGRDGKSRRRRKDDDIKEASMEMTWSLLTMAAHLSQTVGHLGSHLLSHFANVFNQIGLHRDSERWGLSPKMVQRRRVLFWDVFVADAWQSLNTGRPPAFSLAYIDCAFPVYEGVNEKDGKTGEEGQQASTGNTGDKTGAAFGVWQFRFAAECVAEVTARTLTAEAPTYATIMDLDRKVREFPLPEGFGPSSTSSSGLNVNGSPSQAKEEDLAMSFRRCVLDHIRETVLMYIHRAFFAQAIIEHPTNPLKSHYAPSFLAAYRASGTILKSIREQFAIWPIASARFWTMWTFAFTAAVVFGTVVARGPRSPLAQSAMAELEQACILFSRVAIYSKRATKSLPILTNLREKARLALSGGSYVPSPMTDLSLSHSALSRLSTNTSPLSGINGELLNLQKDDMEDELSIFAGHTRFVSSRPRSQNALPPVPGDSASTSRGMPSAGMSNDIVMGINGRSPYGAPGGHHMSGDGVMGALPGMETMPGQDARGPYQTQIRHASRVRGPYDVEVDMDINMDLENSPMRYPPTVQSMEGYAQHGYQPHSSQPPSAPSMQLFDDSHYSLPPPPRTTEPPYHSLHDQSNRPHMMSPNALDDPEHSAWIRPPPSREDTIRPGADYPPRNYPPGYYREDSRQSRDYLPREDYRRDYSQSREDHALHSQAPSNPPPIAIPPIISIPPAPMSASHDRTSSPSHPVRYSYSYDRSSRPNLPSGPSPEVNISAGRRRTASRPSVPSSLQSSSPVRLTHPQYGPPSAGSGPPPRQMDMDTDPYYSRASRAPPSHHEHHHQQYTYPPPNAAHNIHVPSHHSAGGQGVPGNPALADLGLAARDSRLDERWSSFMADSGILDDVSYGNNGRR
ncbi:hypothetical protein D9758_011653 [Tetrapyrgos nigripes]|uniref:Xylanolytic transcriptional activator regulatory domain-containing protein n=1 Tax=Tetrapyrgos nigripes TaxID=182062 RepID=A0A8H5CU13_9AGAR|nr:hypothetical protein D9758_011653 [Tetrapyrgos nigripes]